MELSGTPVVVCGYYGIIQSFELGHYDSLCCDATVVLVDPRDPRITITIEGVTFDELQEINFNA